MSDQKLPFDGLSFRRIVGFACSQSFIIFILYTGAGGEPALFGASFGWFGPIAALASMVAGLLVLAKLPERSHSRVLSRPSLVLCGVLMALVSLCPATFPQAARIACDIAFGLCCSFQIAAWGRSFGMLETEGFLVEVLAGFLLAALFCLLFSLTTFTEAVLLARVLPIASAAWIDTVQVREERVHPGLDDLAAADMLSVKVMCGTFCFGLSTGMLDSFAASHGGLFGSGGVLSLLLFAAFLIGTLSIVVSDGFGKGDSLNKSYRLSLFLFLAGVLIAPLSGGDGIPIGGGSVVLAGFLGLQAVLSCLFLVVSRLRNDDGVLAFSSGFACLFGGQAAGMLFVAAASFAHGLPAYLPVVVAGLIALAACIFLFTERDFDSISKTVEEDDRFEADCRSIAAEFGLSKREAQVLPLVLRGRTSSRIAEELGISKSTVDTHLRHIYAKCGVSGRQGLIDLKEGM